DDSTDPSYAASDATTLVSQDHVDAIIGATGSGMCAAILPVAKLNGVFELSPSCTCAAFTDLSYTGGWFGRTAPSDELQAVVGGYRGESRVGERHVDVLGGRLRPEFHRLARRLGRERQQLPRYGAGCLRRVPAFRVRAVGRSIPGAVWRHPTAFRGKCLRCG